MGMWRACYSNIREFFFKAVFKAHPTVSGRLTVDWVARGREFGGFEEGWFGRPSGRNGCRRFARLGTSGRETSTSERKGLRKSQVEGLCLKKHNSARAWRGYDGASPASAGAHRGGFGSWRSQGSMYDCDRSQNLCMISTCITESCIGLWHPIVGSNAIDGAPKCTQARRHCCLPPYCAWHGVATMQLGDAVVHDGRKLAGYFLKRSMSGAEEGERGISRGEPPSLIEAANFVIVDSVAPRGVLSDRPTEGVSLLEDERGQHDLAKIRRVVVLSAGHTSVGAHGRTIKEEVVVAVHQAEQGEEAGDGAEDAGADEARVGEVAQDGGDHERAHDATRRGHVGHATHASERARSHADGKVEVVEIEHVGNDEHDANHEGRAGDARHHQHKVHQAVSHRVSRLGADDFVPAVADVHRGGKDGATQGAEHGAAAVREHRLVDVVVVAGEGGGLNVLNCLEKGCQGDGELDGDSAGGRPAILADILPSGEADHIAHLLALVEISSDAVPALGIPASEATPPEGGSDDKDDDGSRDLVGINPLAGTGKEAGEAKRERDQANKRLAHDVDQGGETEPDEADAANGGKESGTRHVLAHEVADQDAADLEDAADKVGSASARHGLPCEFVR
eukprot:scaffold2202_cov136-Isochrysis_galbana.AAC.4